MASRTGAYSNAQKNRLEMARQMGMDMFGSIRVSDVIRSGPQSRHSAPQSWQRADSRDRGRGSRRRTDSRERDRGASSRLVTQRTDRMDSREPERPTKEWGTREWDPKKALIEHELKMRKLQEELERQEEEERRQQEEKKKQIKAKMRSLGTVQKRAVQVLPPAPSWGSSSNVATEEKVDEVEEADDPLEEEEDEIDENEELREWRDSFSFRKKKKRRKKDKANLDDDDNYDQNQAQDDESDNESYSRSPIPKRGGPLMTEAEILANRKKRKQTARGSEKVRERIAKEKERWERMKKYMPMDMPEKNMTYSQPRVGPGGGAPRRATMFSGRTC